MSTGKFVWHDLMTTDVKAAHAFYTSLLGWTTTEFDMGPGGKYQMIKGGGKDQGGFVPLDKSHGIPSHWIAYVGVDDVDAACGRAQKLGGKVAVPPTDIPNVGRFAVISDPAGAHISPFKGTSGGTPPDGPHSAGAFCWDELHSTNPDGVTAFYGEVFGWSVWSNEAGEMGNYYHWKAGDRDIGGMMKNQMPNAPSFWLTYIAVDNVDEVTTKAEGLGAKVLVTPKEVPHVGRFSVLADPTGATFALFKSAPDAKHG